MSLARARQVGLPQDPQSIPGRFLTISSIRRKFFHGRFHVLHPTADRASPSVVSKPGRNLLPSDRRRAWILFMRPDPGPQMIGGHARILNGERPAQTSLGAGPSFDIGNLTEQTRLHLIQNPPQPLKPRGDKGGGDAESLAFPARNRPDHRPPGGARNLRVQDRVMGAPESRLHPVKNSFDRENPVSLAAFLRRNPQDLGVGQARAD